MEVIFTQVDTTYACSELSTALANAIPGITQVAMEWQYEKSDRTLVVVLACPCCSGGSLRKLLKVKHAVLVSPFRGIDRDGYNIHRVSKYPPYRTPGEDGEASTLDEYLDSFREVIRQALAGQGGAATY